MRKSRIRQDTLAKKREDAKELIDIIEKIPEEKKSEVLGILRGYALCSENEGR